jgi:hypothetical protein
VEVIEEVSSHPAMNYHWEEEEERKKIHIQDADQSSSAAVDISSLYDQH